MLGESTRDQKAKVLQPGTPGGYALLLMPLLDGLGWMWVGVVASSLGLSSRSEERPCPYIFEAMWLGAVLGLGFVRTSFLVNACATV